MNIEIKAHYKWDKLIDIDYDFKERKSHFSSSERKLALFEPLKNDINDYSVFIADDFDLYWDKKILKGVIGFIFDNFNQVFITFRSKNKYCNDFIDKSLQHLSYEDYLSEIDYNKE